MKISDLVKKLFKKEIGLDLHNPEHLELVKKAYGSYWVFKTIYEKMYRYYKGDTDAIRKYLFVTERSNLKINVNYIKKFIKEEVAYTLGNDITYESRTRNKNIIQDIEYYTAHWDELHDTDVMKYLLIFTQIYELYYIDNDANFTAKIIKPTEGYAYRDKASGKVLFFIHAFKNEFDTTTNYIDVYTLDYIYHFDNKFNEIAAPTKNIFSGVPVTIGILTKEGYKDSLYNDMKGLQDALETNLSDSGNEISDFRNAYLLFKGIKVDEDDIPEMKRKGMLQFDNPNGDASWLIKDVKDAFIQNTLDRYHDTMYELACHINHNEKLQSNLSGITLRSRLIVLENKCSLATKAHKNIVKSRLKFLFEYLDLKKNKKYDYKDVKALYTPNVPSDDLATAQMIAQIPSGIISKDTFRGLFSYVNNKPVEAEKVKKEQQEELGHEVDLDKVVISNEKAN
ncbi:phage portal protein [Clostridium botulinum]|uniref:phage portal protein n=1 Tax=Clostridium TaxID=1485 RepID=UPI0013F0F7BE|nr:phage portal protein [Clostridium botulinum]MCS6110388.1 phage portal protein [Clostridium botulinum]NFE13129.1 phage portal protein [Clostridium botulinum]NFL42221.1 phage portal protein [Clostridium botulinum]NFN21454.1 phage portal protein [Clostridium botulinum]NFN42665.1 phage portal protein [Clostridium botulinum]